MTKYFLYICIGTRTFWTGKWTLHSSKPLQRRVKSARKGIRKAPKRKDIPNKERYMPIIHTVRNFDTFQRRDLPRVGEKRHERHLQVSSRRWNIRILERRGCPPSFTFAVTFSPKEWCMTSLRRRGLRWGWKSGTQFFVSWEISNNSRWKLRRPCHVSSTTPTSNSLSDAKSVLRLGFRFWHSHHNNKRLL